MPVCPHCAAAAVASAPLIIVAFRWLRVKYRLWKVKKEDLSCRT